MGQAQVEIKTDGCARQKILWKDEWLMFSKSGCPYSTLGFGGVRIQFHIPIEVVTPAIRCVSNPDGNGDNGIPTRLHRFLQESHPSFLRCAAALLVVATPARRHDIFPGLSPALGNGNNVIERQFLGSKLVSTILAGIAISREDIDAGEFDGPVDILEPNQFEEPHD